jgi:hypothetical protein
MKMNMDGQGRSDPSLASAIGDYSVMRGRRSLGASSLAAALVPVAIGVVVVVASLTQPVYWDSDSTPLGSPGSAALFAFVIGLLFLVIGALRLPAALGMARLSSGNGLALGTLGFKLDRDEPVMWAEVRVIEAEGLRLGDATLPGPIVVQTGPSALAPDARVRRITIDPASVGSDSLSLLAVMEGCLERFARSQGVDAPHFQVVQLTPDRVATGTLTSQPGFGSAEAPTALERGPRPPGSPAAEPPPARRWKA